MSTVLDTPEVENLVILVEEATRSSKEGVKRFIEPAQGTLRRAVNRRHHIIFGRRGSGKSSLLRKAAADLTVDRRPIAYVDLETFKGHTYPDVLLSILLSALKEFNHWLKTAAIHPANKASFWQKLFGTKPNRSAYNREQIQALSADFTKHIEELQKQLQSSDNTQTTSSTKTVEADTSSFDASANVAFQGVGVGSRAAQSSSGEVTKQQQQTYTHSKLEFLHQHILEYQDLFRRMRDECGGDGYLFLDDLYHIGRANQPQVIDYFHRVAKGNGLWLKVGTIRHRSRWYVNGDPPIGVKLGDDADEIDLDLTLEKYPLAKDFLSKILKSFASDCGTELSTVLNEGATDRMVLASGGVARDFLAIFRRAVMVARQRGDDNRGPKIGSEDVNRAAGEHEVTKREELKRDTVEDQVEIELQFDKIVTFCIEAAQANLFLLDKSASGKEVDLIQELVDLRLIHFVSSRVTVSKKRERYMKRTCLTLANIQDPEHDVALKS
jgi:hypothetical protein